MSDKKQRCVFSIDGGGVDKRSYCSLTGGSKFFYGDYAVQCEGIQGKHNCPLWIK